MSGVRKVVSIEVLTRITAGLEVPPDARAALFLGEEHRVPDAVGSRTDIPSSTTPVDGTGRHAFGSWRGEPHVDVTSVFTSRSEFTSAMPPHALFDTATTIRGAGLSLNIICQQYADGRLQRLLAAGTSMRCLFLDPSGEAIRAREREEGHPTGFLAALTEMNINHLRGIRERLPTEDRERLRFAVYDETIRFHLIFVDDALCVAQPYLPLTRGVDSPTFVIERQAANSGLYPVFDRIFDSMWESGREL